MSALSDHRQSGGSQEEPWSCRDLQALVLSLKRTFGTFLDIPEEDVQAQDRALEEMKRAAGRLYRAMDMACDIGETVYVFSKRGQKRPHVIRTVGSMNPDGTTFRYASEPKAARCLSMCALLSVDRILMLSTC
jgi:hypothetical protein